MWDWNGTLLHDNDAVIAAVNQVCAAYGRPELTWENWREVYARPVRTTYEQILGQVLDDQNWARVDKLYHDQYDVLLPTSKLAADVPGQLLEWASTGRTQSLLSMWFHRQLIPLVEEFGLTGLFSRIDGLAAELGGESKTEHLARHLEAQELRPADVLVIGDVVDDALAAQAVGAQCVLVSTGAMTKAALKATGAPVADTITEALRITGTALDRDFGARGRTE
ncbi:HAD hydrolase-like protein [Kribbella sancticallisti]|uniref:HAD hydrolase-like protein n=1 Tax=Kribbella sancticallisti TaxID=460087 RepID=A0ABP4PIQ3_9ACTN